MPPPLGVPFAATVQNDDDPTLRTKLRFQYAKLGRAFHASHLDVKEHLLRAVRLSGIPAVYTQGFSPRPRVSFSPACPTAVASEAEYFEVLCTQTVDARAYAEKIRTLLPDGLFLTNVEEVDPRGPSIEESVVSMTYVVAPPAGMSVAELRAAVERFRGAERVPVRILRKKRERRLDARVQITEALVVGDALHLTIAFAKQATLKVREAVATILGLGQAEAVRIRKRAVTFRAAGDAADSAAPVAPLLDGPALDLTSLGTRRSARAAPKRRPRNAALASSIPYAE